MSLDTSCPSDFSELYIMSQGINTGWATSISFCCLSETVKLPSKPPETVGDSTMYNCPNQKSENYFDFFLCLASFMCKSPSPSPILCKSSHTLFLLMGCIPYVVMVVLRHPFLLFSSLNRPVPGSAPLA